MKWIVLGVGLATAVLGGWWTWFGLSIVQVERGWSAVIAGSVLVAAGLVIMAIAALMQRVDALARALSALQPHSSAQPAAPLLAPDAQPREASASSPSSSIAAFAKPSAAAPEKSSAMAPATAGSLDAASPSREADMLAAVGAALEFSPAVATDEKLARHSSELAPEAPARSERQQPTAPPAAPSIATPPPFARPAPAAARAPSPSMKPVPKPVSQPAWAGLADEAVGKPDSRVAGEAADRRAPDAPKAEPKQPSSVPPNAETNAERAKEQPPAPEPRVENARATSDAPAVVSPAPPAGEPPPAPMLGPVLSPAEDGDGPKRKPSSFSWLEKARQRDQLRARKADENTSDAPPVLSPGAPALDETDAAASSAAKAKTPAPAPEPALQAAKPPEAEPADRAKMAETVENEPDVPGALAGAPVTPSGEGAGTRLVRRYDSQGVKYNLYEDGTIEAESESGMYRFASLAELRAFLEKRA